MRKTKWTWPETKEKTKLCDLLFIHFIIQIRGLILPTLLASKSDHLSHFLIILLRKFISVFINGTFDEQITLSYKLFSNPQTKTIEVEKMCLLIKDVVAAEDSLSKFFNEELINMIVKETFLKS